MTIDALITAGNSAQRKGDPTGAAALYAKAIADDPTNAIALYDLGDLDQTALYEGSAAEAEYERALAIAPHFVDARFNLAILQSTGQPMRAIASYQTLIGFDATDAYAYLNLGFLLRTVGQTSASAAAFHKAVALDPGLKSRMSQPISAK
jgi:tetratricopeptide (TPR) repeat protein